MFFCQFLYDGQEIYDEKGIIWVGIWIVDHIFPYFVITLLEIDYYNIFCYFFLGKHTPGVPECLDFKFVQCLFMKIALSTN